LYFNQHSPGLPLGTAPTSRRDPIVLDEPRLEPVNRAEVIQSLALTESALVTADLDELDRFIRAARRMLETDTGRTFHQTTLRALFDCWPCSRFIELPRATPLLEIAGVTLKNQDGTDLAWDPANYIADTYSNPGRIVLGVGKLWPSLSAYPVGRILIDYTAGVPDNSADQQECPDDAKTACLLLIGSLNENRESEIVPDRNISGTVEMRLYQKLVSQLRVPSAWAEI
jgi:uncharacterized phiE125 gp8 family phage protein